MKIAFCVQYNTRPAWIDEVPSDWTLIELCWSKTQPENMKTRGGGTIIYFPNSSWTQGRNRMFEAVKQYEKEGDKFDYVIFSDDDIAFRGMTYPEAFKTFQDALEKYKPAVALPNYCWHFKDQKHFDPDAEIQGIYATDVIFEAMHRDTWPVLLPYWTEFDHLSWWNACHIDNRVAGTTFRGAVISVNRVYCENKESRPYPREDRCKSADEMLDEMAVQPNLVHKHQTEESFMPQPLNLRDSYVMDRNQLMMLWNLEHRFWKNRYQE